MKRTPFHRLRITYAVLGLAALSFAQCAHATTISGNLTADNAFFAYISTSNSSLGTLVTSGNSWGTTFSFTNFALTPGQTYYLQVEGINYGGPGAIIGQFNLSDTGFHFANGSQTLLTGTTNWLASYNDSNSNPSNQQTWVTPTGGVIDEGANGVSPWGMHSGISASAHWIDGATNGLSTCGNCTVDFSATIVSSVAATPEPGTLGLLGSALLGAGLMRFRRRR
jgi:hypothetical protein